MADNVEPIAVTAASIARERATAARNAASAAIAEADAAEAEAEAVAVEAEQAETARKAEIDGEHSMTDKPERSPRSRIVVAAFAVVAVVIAGLGSTSVYFAAQHRSAEASSTQRLAYLQAARQGVTNILSVNFDTADADVQRILDGSSGPWRDEFTPQAAPFIDVVKKAQVVTTAEVTDAGLEGVDENGTARVLIAAVSKVTNSAGAIDDPRSFRVRVSVGLDSGQLKISKMEYIPS